MLSIVVTLLVSQFERSPTVEIPELLENILPMLVTFEVSQLERSRAMGVVRPASMPPMLVTLLVFQPEIELRSVMRDKLENILPMLVTFEVSHPARELRSVREEQPENMSIMLVVCDTSSLDASN